jgi:hypothetical protein
MDQELPERHALGRLFQLHNGPSERTIQVAVLHGWETSVRAGGDEGTTPAVTPRGTREHPFAGRVLSGWLVRSVVSRPPSAASVPAVIFLLSGILSIGLRSQVGLYIFASTP